VIILLMIINGYSIGDIFGYFKLYYHKLLVVILLNVILNYFS
jgi:hypothetical protein